MKVRLDNTTRRKLRTRAKIRAVSDRPRLIVFRSNKHIYAQLVDDTGKILAGVSDKAIKGKQAKVATALEVGKTLGELAVKKKITAAVFDRGSYKYHGRVKAVCDGARGASLII